MVTLITTEVTRELLIYLYTKLTGNCSHEKSQDWLGEQDDPGVRRTDFEGGRGVTLEQANLYHKTPRLLGL